jgi:hypothetical protein
MARRLYRGEALGFSAGDVQARRLPVTRTLERRVDALNFREC